MKKNLLIVAALLLAAGTLQAESITQTNTFTGTPNYTSYLTFDKFNTMGGIRTLTGINVSIFLLTEAQGSVGVDNDGASVASGTNTMGTTLNVVKHTGVSNPLILDENDNGFSTIYSTTSKSMSLAADDGDGATYSTSGLDYDVMSIIESQSSSFMAIGSAYWAKYQANGSETFVFDATVSQFTDLSSFGGAQVLINPMAARGNVVVTYNFIPEPATAPLMALVALVGFWIRRRFMA